MSFRQTPTPTQSPLDAKGLDAAVDAYMAFRPKSMTVCQDFGMQQRERISQQVAAAIRAYIASQEASAPSEADYALRHYDPVRVALEKQEALAFEEDREEDHLYWRHEIKALDDARNAALASPAVAPVTVSVKPLQWEQPDGDMATETSSWLGHGTDLCQYCIGFQGGSWWSPFDGEDGEEYPTIEAAKAAAQSEYERRILSSIIPATKPAVGVIEALKAAEEELRRLRCIFLPEYEGKIGEPDASVLAKISAALSAGTATPKPEVEK